ncbi:S8 family serine peptidase [bacterium]|nr:S8 family serine peptidase [bacterium]
MKWVPLFFLCFTSIFCSDGKIIVSNNLNSHSQVEVRGLIIDFQDEVTQEQIESFEKKRGIDVEPIPGFFKAERWTIARKVVDFRHWIHKLKKSPLVEHVEPNYVMSVFEDSGFRNPNPEDFNDPYYKFQWHMAQIGLSEASRFSTGKGAVVAVIDTGVAFEKHGEFNVARDLNQAEFVAPYNFLANNKHANDDHGHGTHVAGTIAQSTNNELGVVGVAPAAKIMPLKVLDKSGRGTIDGIARAIRYAADKGAHVINMSLGGPMPSRALRKALQYAHKKGVLSICAAGNSGRSVGYPAKYPECVAVSAVQYDEKITFYSSRGPEIEIAAPGGNVQVDQNGDGYPDGVLQNTIYTQNPGKDDYMLFMGTSMAAPHVAGAAALLVSAGVSHANKIRSILKDSSRKKGSANEYGSGILDVGNALKAAVLEPGWFRLICAFLLGGLFLRRRITQFFHPLSLIGLGIFGVGLFPLAYLFPVDSLSGLVSRPIPEWDLFLFGPEQGNAIFRSSFWVLIMAGFFFQYRKLRPFFQGVGFGLGAYLLVGAFFAPVDLAYVPEQFYGEFFWYIANAWLAILIGQNVNKPADLNPS